MKRIIALMVVLTCGSAMVASAADAKENWDKQCAKCHGKEGKGDTKMGQKVGVKDYTDAKVQTALKDEAMAKAIKEGAKDKDGRSLMKPTEGVTDQDVKGLIALIRGFKK